MEQFELPPGHGSVALSQEQINLRQRFVSEYTKDRDALKACLRMGYNISYARDAGKTLFLDPYVQHMLAALDADFKSTPEHYNDSIRSRNQAKSALMQVINCGRDEKAIVAALKLKFQIDKEESNQAGSVSAGVMVVPGIADVSSWETAAITTQEVLQRVSARD